jgi:hypothetical protein
MHTPHTPAAPIAFCELPDPVRFAFLSAVDDLSGPSGARPGRLASAWHYSGSCVVVAVPRGKFSELRQLATRYGLELCEAQMHYFPLGSDNPPDALRHDGNYPGSKGFWLWAPFRPVL